MANGWPKPITVLRICPPKKHILSLVGFRGSLLQPVEKSEFSRSGQKKTMVASTYYGYSTYDWLIYLFDAPPCKTEFKRFPKSLT
jgi:hypothetical protein